jgi:hypothetical protein
MFVLRRPAKPTPRPPTEAASIMLLVSALGYCGTPSTVKERNFAYFSLLDFRCMAIPALQPLVAIGVRCPGHRYGVRYIGSMRLVSASAVLLLLEHDDVAHRLTLSVLALHCDVHRLPVRRDDSPDGLSHRTALLVSAFGGPCVDSLE